MNPLSTEFCDNCGLLGYQEDLEDGLCPDCYSAEGDYEEETQEWQDDHFAELWEGEMWR